MQHEAGPATTQRVHFYTKAVESQEETSKQGFPVFVNKVYVRVESPGDLKSIYDQPAEPVDFQRWPQAYAAFQQHGDGAVAGVPLRTLATLRPDVLTPADMENLAARRIVTVEQLAAMDPAALMGMSDRAGQWVPLAKEHLGRTADPDGLKAENERLRKQMENLQRMVETMAAKQDAQEAAPKRKGRPPKGSAGSEGADNGDAGEGAESAPEGAE